MPGPFGPGIIQGGYWNLAKAWIPAHQATSQHIAGIYPFVADTGLGHRGPILGVDLNADALWHFSPWEAYVDTTERGTFSTNILVLGAYRGGKSATVKTLVTRSIAFGHQVVVPSDPKGEWVAVAEAIPGGRVIRLGGGTGTRLNPLDRGPRRTDTSDEQHEQMVQQRRIGTLIALIEMTLGGRLTAVEHAAILDALDRCITDTGDHPTLRGVYEELGRPGGGHRGGVPGGGRRDPAAVRAAPVRGRRPVRAVRRRVHRRVRPGRPHRRHRHQRTVRPR